MRGASAPLSSQESISFIYSGSGWRGARGEVNSTYQMQIDPKYTPARNLRFISEGLNTVTLMS